MSQATADPIESMDDFFAKTGPLPPAFDDLRRFPRFYYRSCASAVVHPLVKGQGEPQRTYVLTQDLSRSGINIIHATQLYPGQRLELHLGNGLPKNVTVSWCRRLPTSHYAAGCQFVKVDANVTDEAEVPTGKNNAVSNDSHVVAE